MFLLINRQFSNCACDLSVDRFIAQIIPSFYGHSQIFQKECMVALDLDMDNFNEKQRK